RAEGGEMRAAIGVRDGIGERQNLVVVTVVVLQHDIHKNFVALSRDYDRLWMQDLFVLAELPNELFNPVFVIEALLLRRIDAFISERNLQTGIQKRQLAQPRRKSFKLELRRDGENCRIGQESNERARRPLVFNLPNYHSPL